MKARKQWYRCYMFLLKSGFGGHFRTERRSNGDWCICMGLTVFTVLYQWLREHNWLSPDSLTTLHGLHNPGYLEGYKRRIYRISNTNDI